MDYKELAAKYFYYHNNPLIKVELPSKKLFLDDPNAHEEDIEKYRYILQNSLEYERVERRCGRCKGEWIENLNLCKVTKVIGPLLKNFGFQDKKGVFLLPEETLFLMEKNRLELTYNSEQVSINQGYDIVLSMMSLEKYRVYKKLVMQGFKLMDKNAVKRFYMSTPTKSEDVKISLKRKSDILDNDMCGVKFLKVDVPSGSESSNPFEAIFQRLREKGPKMVGPEKFSRTPDFYGFLPLSSSSYSHDFNLYIREKFKPDDFGMHEDIPNIFALCTFDNVGFYRFPRVDIPYLT